jgi:exopolysaccharide production protein ExoQ
MPPSLALFLWLLLLLALLRWDPASDFKASRTLWVPTIWMVILGSRLPSQWLGVQGTSAADVYQEGNLLDRTIYVILILVALAILHARSMRWDSVMKRNLALVAFLAFTFLSIAWSDFPFVALKRWIRDFGGYLMILIVLTDPRPVEAVNYVLRRLCYLLIPLSVVLIKYYPEIGKGYSEWIGAADFHGVTLNKNLLGIVCLISGIFFLWDTLNRWRDRKDRRIRRVLVVNAVFMAMTLWLLNLAHSATSQVCLLLGCLIIVAGHSRPLRRNPGVLRVMLPTALCLYLFLEFAFNITDAVIYALGRDTTLTGRTELWTDLLNIGTNPLFGAGYESFWLGDRLTAIWARHTWRPNQAHNGYLEVYLNLGLIGLALLVTFLISSYRTISGRLASAPHFALLGLTMWTVLLAYNVTEAAFKSQLVWFIFLLGAMTAPALSARRSWLRTFPSRARQSLAGEPISRPPQ